MSIFGEVPIRNLLHQQCRRDVAGRMDMYRRGKGLLSGLGQDTPETRNLEAWYKLAKAEVSKFESLKLMAAQVASPVFRKQFIEYLGDSSKVDTPNYRYLSVVSDIRDDVEAYTPINIGAYTVERRRNRILQLRDINDKSLAMVSAAAKQYGTVDPPEVIEKIVEKIKTVQVEVPVEKQVEVQKATIPTEVLVVGGLLAVGLVAVLLLK